MNSAAMREIPKLESLNDLLQEHFKEFKDGLSKPMKGLKARAINTSSSGGRVSTYQMHVIDSKGVVIFKKRMGFFSAD